MSAAQDENDLIQTDHHQQKYTQQINSTRNHEREDTFATQSSNQASPFASFEEEPTALRNEDCLRRPNERMMQDRDASNDLHDDDPF